MNAFVRSLGILVACLPSVRAAVIWSGPRDISLPSNINGVFVNLVTGTATTTTDLDFINTDINFFFGGDGILTGPGLLPARTGTAPTDPIMLVSAGIPVDETMNFASPGFGASQGHIGAGPGQFPSGTEGYFAFQFDPSKTNNYAYGWMRVTLTDGSGPGTLHDWAYSNTPGEPVSVGVVPEPRTLALAGLGLALFAARRRPGRA